MSLGQELKKARTARRHSQSEAAAAMGVSYKAFGDWERDKVEPQDGNAAAIRAYIAGTPIARPLTVDEKRVHEAVSSFRVIARMAREMAALADKEATALEGGGATPPDREALAQAVAGGLAATRGLRSAKRPAKRAAGDR